MTITTTILRRGEEGNRRIVEGKSVLSGTTNTGDVVCSGLKIVEFFEVLVKGTAQQGSAVNEDFPLGSNTVTVYVETNDSTFYWRATGIRG